MIQSEQYKKLIGLKPKTGSIILFPPLCENDLSKLDISLNLVFSPELNYTFTTSANLWTTEIIKNDDLNELTEYDFDQFDSRLNYWMHSENALEAPLLKERFDITEADEFNFMFQNQIDDIKFLELKNSIEFNPYGIRIEFNGRYIFSFAGYDGNIIVSDKFLSTINPYNFHSQIGESILGNG